MKAIGFAASPVLSLAGVFKKRKDTAPKPAAPPAAAEPRMVEQGGRNAALNGGPLL